RAPPTPTLFPYTTLFRSLSEKKFGSLFRDQVGLSPKHFQRIARFRKVIAELEPTREIDWVDLALSCGYHDQAHFNHDFRGLAGRSEEHTSELQSRENLVC